MEKYAENVIKLVVLVLVCQTKIVLTVYIHSRKELIRHAKYVLKLVFILILLLKFAMNVYQIVTNVPQLTHAKNVNKDIT